MRPPNAPRARRQLNNYGFRKCHTDRYEFGVPGFQRGAPELLKTLKRHDAQRQSKKPSSAAKAEQEEGLGSPTGAGAPRRRRRSHADTDAPPFPCDAALVEVGVYGGMHSEVEQLKRDRLLLLKEVMRLRETSAHTASEVRALNTRLANTEAMQQQMLTFLQQHISPTLLNANSHILQGRKRRHLLLGPASPGREDASMDLGLGAAAAAPLPIPLAGGAAGGSVFDDAPPMFGAGPVPPFAAGASPPGSGVLLRELPDADSVPYGLRPRGVNGVGGRAPSAGLSADALMPSYNALMPPPPLPDVLSLPQLAPEGDIFSWSDLLADLPAAEPGAPGAAHELPLSRMNSEDIHKIVRDMQLDGPPSLDLPAVRLHGCAVACRSWQLTCINTRRLHEFS